MRTVQTTRPRPGRGVLAAGLAVAGLALTGCSGGGEPAPKGTSTTAAASSTTPSSSDPAAAAPTPTSGGSSALLLDEDAPASVPASLFQEDGPTLEEWAADQADFRDLEGVTRIEESVADGDLRLTLADVPEGTRHRVVLGCPDGATGGSSLSLGEGGAVERGVWSEDCGWTATLPPLSEQRDVTFLVRADDGGPFRFVVGEVEGDGQG